MVIRRRRLIAGLTPRLVTGFRYSPRSFATMVFMISVVPP